MTYRNRQTGGRRYPGSRRRTRLRVGRLIFLIAALALIITLAVTGTAHVRDTVRQKRIEEAAAAWNDVFIENVYLDGESLAGRGYDEVLAEFTARYEARLATTLTLSFSGATWQFNPATVGGATDVVARVNEAWNYGHVGIARDRLAEIEQVAAFPVHLRVSLAYDRDALAAFAQSIKDAVDKQPVNATMTVLSEGETSFTDAQIGYSLNLEETENLLVNAVETGVTGEVELLPTVLEPEVTQESLAATYQKLTVYATYFRGSSDNRAANVRRALENFDGMIVLPGQRVSFNSVVGKRTEGRGYLSANEYIGGQVQVGIGGGTCQASTTLYGALLRAGLTINERHNHSLPVSYVEPSQDATVSDTGLDLVFTNNTESPLYFYVSVNKQKMRAMVTIYGQPVKAGVRIEVESEITQPDIAATNVKYVKDEAGDYVWYEDEQPVLKTEGKLGYRSRAYRVYYNAETSEELKRELLSEDYYEPTPATYYVGVH